MKYTSSRNSSVSCTFEEAVCSGYAPDGGLFVPEQLPSISEETLKKWSELAYPDLSKHILRLFISPDEISDDDLGQICTSAFEGFEDPARAVSLVKLGPLYVAELFRGPTFCFKDLGMRAVVNILSYFATRRQRSITLVVSTTGDTGPAAVQAVSDTANPYLSILVHFPHGQISEFQRRQLTTVQSSCVRVAAFQGGGDDMDIPIKRMLTGQERNGHTLWTGVNSHNIGRPLMQMVHFVYVYLRVAEQEGIEIGDPSRTVDFILPTGAMGNLVGGYMAKRMGIPVGMLNSGVNVNDITDRVIRTGAFHKSPVMLRTLSEAINIQVPYNFERILYYLTNQNSELVRKWMTQMGAAQRLDLSAEWLEKLQQEFNSERVTDGEMCETMRSVWQQHDYLADPHAAVALTAALRFGCSTSKDKKSSPNRLAAVLATASPCKFQEAVKVAIGEEGWIKYQRSSAYPKSAELVSTKKEKPPTIYEAVPGKTLAENQLEWERLARSIVGELESLNYTDRGTGSAINTP